MFSFSFRQKCLEKTKCSSDLSSTLLSNLFASVANYNAAFLLPPSSPTPAPAPVLAATVSSAEHTAVGNEQVPATPPSQAARVHAPSATPSAHAHAPSATATAALAPEPALATLASVLALAQREAP